MATIDGFRHNLLGANNHSMVFDNCASCQESGAQNCDRCRKSLQLRDLSWQIILGEGADHSAPPRAPAPPCARALRGARLAR